MVELHLHKPRPPLDTFVESITYYRGFMPDHTKEKLLPDGAVEIIVDLTDRPKRLYDPDSHVELRAFRKSWISGMRGRWLVIEAAPASSMLVVRFRPGGAYPFLGLPVEGLTDVVDCLDAVMARTAASLRDRILEAIGPAERLGAAERWLLEQGSGRLETHPAVEYLTSRLFAPAGLRIADVVSEVGYSQRHLLGLFRRWVGMSPKHYQRIRRFQQVLHGAIVQRDPGHDAARPEFRAVRLSEPDWADVALEFGYYDQAHLARDFKAFSGLSPRRYLEAYRGQENYLPLDGPRAPD